MFAFLTILLALDYIHQARKYSSKQIIESKSQGKEFRYLSPILHTISDFNRESKSDRELFKARTILR